MLDVVCLVMNLKYIAYGQDIHLHTQINMWSKIKNSKIIYKHFLFIKFVEYYVLKNIVDWHVSLGGSIEFFWFAF